MTITVRLEAPLEHLLRQRAAMSGQSTCALRARRIHNAAALDFLRWVQRGGVTLDRPDASALPDVLRISERFADLPFDLADASIAEAAARLKLRQVLSVDADFDVFRDRQGRPLKNLLRPG